MVHLRDNDRLNFNIVMPLASADGYGASGEELVRAAAVDHNANIGVLPHDWIDDRYTAQEVLDLRRPIEEIHNKEVLLVYFIPYAFYQFQSEFTIGQTMFETTEIPDVWANFSELVKGLIVPTKFCQEVFLKKVNRPVEVVPLGVNLNNYYAVKREESDVFTFLMTGLLHYRKGADIALRAFQEEFEPDEAVRLILKTRKGFLDLGSQAVTDPRVHIINADYDRSDMLALYHAGDCFVACSRGEASGLTPREALATGLSSIVTNWGGLSEIADSRYTYPLDIIDEVPAPAFCSSYDRGITQGQSIGNFAEPSVEHLRKLMRYVYEHPDENSKKGLDAALWIQNNWNFSTCAKKWLEAIERLYDG